MDAPATRSTDRNVSIDALRGFSLLGILLLNINSFGLPFAAYFNPQVWGGATGADLTIWVVAMTGSKICSPVSLVAGCAWEAGT